MLPNKRAEPTRGSVIDWQSRMRAAFVEGIGEGDMRDVVKALVARAKGGDMAAIRMVIAYAVGQPRETVDAGAELPQLPTRALPRTPDKLAAFSERAQRGEGLFHPRDANHEEIPS